MTDGGEKAQPKLTSIEGGKPDEDQRILSNLTFIDRYLAKAGKDFDSAGAALLQELEDPTKAKKYLQYTLLMIAKRLGLRGGEEWIQAFKRLLTHIPNGEGARIADEIMKEDPLFWTLEAQRIVESFKNPSGKTLEQE